MSMVGHGSPMPGGITDGPSNVVAAELCQGGLGSLPASRLPRFLRALIWPAIVGFSVLFFGCLPLQADDLSPQNPSAVELVMRLQFRLLCETAVDLEGTIELDHGRWGTIENLSSEANTTGAFWTSETQRQLHIRPRGMTKQLGFAIDFEGPREATAIVDLRALRGQQAQLPSGQSEQDLRIAIPIQTLVNGTYDELIGGGIRLQANRVGADALRIQVGDSDSMVFATGQTLPWWIETTAPPDLGRRPLALSLQLRRDGDKSVVWQQTRNLSPETSAQINSGARVRVSDGQWTLPQIEGVYTFTAKLSPANSFRLMPTLPGSRFLGTMGAAPATLERSVQFVVLSPFPDEVDTTPFTELARWRPENRSILSLGLTAASSKEPIVQAERSDQAVALIAPQDQVRQTSPVLQKDRPHVLVIRYSRAEKVSFTIGIRDTVGGRLPTDLEHDIGVVDSSQESVPEDVRANPEMTNPAGLESELKETFNGPPVMDENWGEYRLVFWPTSSRVELLLTNNLESTQLAIESIRIEAGPSRLAGGLSPVGPGRTVAVYLDKPTLREVFSSKRQQDLPSGVFLDDWNTILEAGKRLVDYVQYRGGNAAVLTVFAEGGGLYPSKHFFPTIRFDTGLFFSDGRDPVRKDVLELLMRLFDRAGLRLIPSIELAMPLPALERKIFEYRQAAALAPTVTGQVASQSPRAFPRPAPASPWEWSDSVGRRWVEGRQPSRHGLAPYYNLLNREVQWEIRQIFNELSTRYRGHRSLSAIGVSIGNQTYLQLPTPQWGRDVETLQTFREYLQVSNQLPPELTAQQWQNDPWFNRWIDHEGNALFTAWRSRVVTQFFKQLAADVSDKPLVIVPADYLPIEYLGHEQRGIQHGLDWRELSASQNIIPLRLQRFRPLLEPAQRIDDARMNEDELWDALMGTNSGGLVFYPSQSLHSGTGETQQSAMLQNLERNHLVTAVSGARESQRELMKLLSRVDCQLIALGGWTPVTGHEQSMASTLRLLTKLPAQKMDKVIPKDESGALATVRQARVGKNTIVYVTNPSRWTLETRLFCDAAAGTTIRMLAEENLAWPHGSRFIAPGMSVPNGTSLLWSGKLLPGQATALEIQGPGNGVVHWTATPNKIEQVQAWTASEVEDLAARIAILGRPRQVTEFNNGGFEIGDEHKPVGWLRSQYPEDCVRFTSEAVEGTRAAELSNSGEEANRTWILSEILPTPVTGRFAVSIHARLIAGTPTLRLALEGKLHGQPVRYTETVPLRADRSWGESPRWLKVVQPSLADLQEARIAIDLLGQGSVAIDDVRLYDFFLTEKERSELQRQTFVASERLKRGDLSIASALIDSHWARFLKQLDLPVTGTFNNPSEAATKDDGGQQPGLLEQPAKQGEENTRGIAERIRNWLPSPLRF